jgi:hypothetical protein
MTRAHCHTCIEDVQNRSLILSFLKNSFRFILTSIRRHAFVYECRLWYFIITYSIQAGWDLQGTALGDATRPQVLGDKDSSHT